MGGRVGVLSLEHAPLEPRSPLLKQERATRQCAEPGEARTRFVSGFVCSAFVASGNDVGDIWSFEYALGTLTRWRCSLTILTIESFMTPKSISLECPIRYNRRECT